MPFRPCRRTDPEPPGLRSGDPRAPLARRWGFPGAPHGRRSGARAMHVCRSGAPNAPLERRSGPAGSTGGAASGGREKHGSRQVARVRSMKLGARRVAGPAGVAHEMVATWLLHPCPCKACVDAHLPRAAPPAFWDALFSCSRLASLVDRPTTQAAAGTVCESSWPLWTSLLTTRTPLVAISSHGYRLDPPRVPGAFGPPESAPSRCEECTGSR